MSWHSIKIDPSDRDFSKYIRLKGKRCVKCNRRGSGDLQIDGLQASHFHGRAKWTTRFDETNVDVLCAGCHRWFTEHKTEYEEWKLERMGQKEYDLLLLRANTTGKKDFKLARMVWKKELADLLEELGN